VSGHRPPKPAEGRPFAPSEDGPAAPTPAEDRGALSRRALLGSGALAVGAVALTACAGGRAVTPPAPRVPRGTAIAALSDIPVGGTLATVLDGKPILLSQPAAGTVVAFSGVCTHRGCTVDAMPAEFHCGCHGSRFEASTGEVLQGPAERPLARIAVAISGGNVVTT